MSIKIIIQGPQGSGKVPAATLIKTLLNHVNVSADIYITDNDVNVSEMEKV